MAVSYTTATKTARMTATRDHFANGTLEIQAANGTVLATFTLTATGGTISGAVWTLAFAASTVSGGASGNASQAVIKTSGGVADITGLTVGTTGTDIVLDNVSISAGQNVTLSSATITHAA
jgi:hypothetical protein